MKKVKETIGWGVVLWLIGYVLGIVLFFVLPPSVLGWTIMPIGITITVYMSRKIDGNTIREYIPVAIWLLIAVVLDYMFIVKLLNEEVEIQLFLPHLIFQ